MCVVSMIRDHYYDKWLPLQQPTWTWSLPPPITAEEIAEFRRLLERAREYDKKTGQPDSELAEKRKKVAALAESLGVRIAFLEED